MGNGRIVGSKPLYVALAQRKEDRKNHLASQYMQRLTTTRLQNQQISQVFTNPAGAAVYLPNMQNPAARFYPAANGFNAPVRSTPRWPVQTRGQVPGNSYQNYQMVKTLQFAQLQDGQDKPEDKSLATATKTIKWLTVDVVLACHITNQLH